MKKIALVVLALALSVMSAIAQPAPLTGPPTGVAGAYNATPPTCTSGQPCWSQTDVLGNLKTVLSQGGTSAQISLDGALSVNTPAYPQFADTFSAALDTTTNWTNTSSTGTAAVASGELVISSSTTASAWGGVTTQQTYTPVGVSSQVWGTLAKFTVLAQANSVRVFGVYNAPGTPTTAVPVTDGYVYRLDGTGALFAEIWSSGVAVSSTNVTSTCLPAANTPAIFAIVFRASLVQFTCGTSIPVPLTPIQGINPINQVLKAGGNSIAGSTPPAASAVMSLSAFALATISPGAIKSQGMAATINDPYYVVGQSPVMPQTYPTLYSLQTTPIQGNASGTTGAVVGTLAAAAAKFTYLCDFDVTALGTAASVGPIVIAGLAGGSKTYQMGTLATGTQQFLSKNWSPCLQSSAVNTAITITTTADGTATAVNVNSSGYQQ
jgi:hypothetical protein